jgi:hypothetical protein
MKFSFPLLTALLLAPLAVHALDYPCTTVGPRKIGWPLTEEENAYVLKPQRWL